MSVFGRVFSGIVVIAVVIVLTSIAATDFKTLTFAEDEWEDLTESLGAFDTEAVQDPLEEPSLLDQNPEDEPEPGESKDVWTVIGEAITSLPVISEIVEATVAIATAIYTGVLVIADLVQKGITSLLALTRFLFAITTFDIPALNAHPFLQLIRVLLALPVWLGIPYLVVRLLRGGG